MKLTNRELWLMDQAWIVAKSQAERFGAHDNHPGYINCKEWLDDDAADGVTVEMVLAKDAPYAWKLLNTQAEHTHFRRTFGGN